MNTNILVNAVDSWFILKFFSLQKFNFGNTEQKRGTKEMKLKDEK